MLFGSQPRFSRDRENRNHVGPGVYYDTAFEDKRNGWASKSFSTRQPMAPGKRQNGSYRYEDRSYMYTAGKLTSTGIALPSNPRVMDSPGPGYYSPPVISPPKLSNPNSAGTMGSSARKMSTKAVIKGDIIVQGVDHDTSVGPGYYSPQTSSMIRHSYNIHAQTNTPVKSSTDKSPEFHQVYNPYPHRPSHVNNNGMKKESPNRDYKPIITSNDNSQANRSKSAPSANRDRRSSSLPQVADFFTSPMSNSPRGGGPRGHLNNQMFLTPEPMKREA